MAKVRGKNSVLRNMQIYAKMLRSDLTLAVFTAITNAEGKAKNRVISNDGKLKQSIYHKMDYIKATAQLGATEMYAPYVEFGTGTKVSIPKGFEEMAMKFYVNGKGTMSAHPFLIPAFLEESQNFKNDSKKIIEKYSGVKSKKRK